MIYWVDGWFSRSMGGVRPITKYRINLYLIEIIQFCLKIYDLLRHPHLWVGEWVGEWVGSGKMTNLIKLELIDIIQFCLKIYDLWRHPHLGIDGWVNGWAHVKSLKSNKS